MLNEAGVLGIGAVTPERLQNRLLAGIRMEVPQKVMRDFNLPLPCKAANKLIMKNHN